MGVLTDSEIIDLYFERDQLAIKETDEKYGNYLKKIAYNILLDLGDAEECNNEVYFKTWNKIPPEKPNIFSAFLAKISRNTALDKYRAKNAKKRGTLEESLDELSECVGENSIENTLMAKELSAVLSEFLKAQRPESRGIFIRRYFYCDSIKDIAKFYLMSQSAVKTSLSRTRNKLKQFLTEKEVVF